MAPPDKLDVNKYDCVSVIFVLPPTSIDAPSVLALRTAPPLYVKAPAPDDRDKLPLVAVIRVASVPLNVIFVVVTERLAPSIEMSLHWRVDQLLGYLRSWSATDAYEKAKGENPVDRLIPLLGAINKLGDQTLKVSWPLTVLAGYAPA